MSSSNPTSLLSIDQALGFAKQAHQLGDLNKAKVGYQAILARVPEHPDALYLLGLVLYRQHETKQAISLVHQATLLDPGHALSHASLAQIYQNEGGHKRAVLYFRRAVELMPANPDVHNGLGVSLMQLGKVSSAKTALMRAIQLNPDMVEAHNNLGNAHRLVDDFPQAEQCYLRCLALQPSFEQAHNNLGVLYRHQQKAQLATQCFKAAIAANPNYAEAYNNLGAGLNDQAQLAPALVAFEKALRLKPDFPEAMINAGIACHSLGDNARAKQVLDRALSLTPENLSAQWARCVVELEAVYVSVEKMQSARQAYAERLKIFSEALDLTTVEKRRHAQEAVGLVQPFLLAYQARNDFELQAIYGKMLCDMMAQNRPLKRASQHNKEVKVGLVSAYFYDHSNWKIPIESWFDALLKVGQVFVYHTGTKYDAITAAVQNKATQFYAGLSADQCAQQIQDDNIDVLIYPEIGMHPVTAQLATQRLAEVQCASWGHPVSSGFPSIDYFLSSALMEPADAQSAYSEKLVKLPGLSMCWRVPEHPNAPPAQRSLLGLELEDVVYLCVQNLSKYLPQHDALMVAIARRVQAAKFVFIEGQPLATMKLKSRLAACFKRADLTFETYVCFVPRLDRDAYFNLNRCADIFLDTPQWSGCNSSLEALACGVPVVTLSGRWMRGRHSMAFYKKMQYETLIASDEMHYIELAVRLGIDAKWRKAQRSQIKQSLHFILDDKQPDIALGEFIKKVVGKAE